MKKLRAGGQRNQLAPSSAEQPNERKDSSTGRANEQVSSRSPPSVYSSDSVIALCNVATSTGQDGQSNRISPSSSRRDEQGGSPAKESVGRPILRTLSTTQPAFPACLYCAETIDTNEEDYCQLGGRGDRYWHIRCVERSRERREATMMLMHSMNKLTSNFFEKLQTPPTDGDVGDDDRSGSNTTEEGDADTEGTSSATEGDLTIRSNSNALAKRVTLWDDSDVSDAEATLRRNNSGSSLKKSDRHHAALTTPTSSMPGSGGEGHESSSVPRATTQQDGGTEHKQFAITTQYRQGVRRAAAWRPQPTVYRSLSFELDSAGNTIRPKPKRQRGKERVKDKKESHQRQHRYTDAVPPSCLPSKVSSSLDTSEVYLSPLASPQLEASATSSHSSEDEASHFLVPSKADNDVIAREHRERPKKKKRSKTEKGRGSIKCSSCGEEGDYVHLGGSIYHLCCFPCSICQHSHLYQLAKKKVVCRECLPQCDGCGLPLIPPPSTRPKGFMSQKRMIEDEKDDPNKGGNDENLEGEIVVELNGVLHQYHKQCVFFCGSCKQPVQRKRGKMYKKEGKPWCARCIAKCPVFEEKAFQYLKSAATIKSRSYLVQGPVTINSCTLEDILNEESSATAFIDYLINDHIVENILFYLDVEAFKKLKRKQDIIIQANNIYNKYLITEAELEVMVIDIEERKKLTYILANKTSKIKNNFFDTAQKQVFHFLKENILPQYMKKINPSIS